MCIKPALRQGFTLIELVVYLVVFAVGLTGILSVYIQAVRSSADPLYTTQALLLGESLLEEITSKPYADPNTTENNEDRTTWDDVSDFVAYDATTSPTDVTGSVIPGLEDYRVAIVISDDKLDGIAGKHIELTVTHTSDSAVKIKLMAWRFPDQ